MAKKYKGGSGKNFLSNPINIVVMVIYTILVSLIYYYNPLDVIKKHGRMVLMGSLGILFFIITTMVLKSTGIIVRRETIWDTLRQYSKAWGNIGLFFAVIFGIGLFFYFIAWLFNGSAATFVFYKVILSILITIGILALFILRYGENIKASYDGEDTAFKSRKIIDLILNIIFYIPCLFIDFVNYLKKEYNLTPTIAWIILAIEIVFVGLIYLIPWLFGLITSNKGTRLQKDPIYTDAQHILGTYENLSENNEGDTFSYNYGLSSWVWINPQPPSTNRAYNKYTTLLSYGDKPRISYNSATKTLQVEVKLNSDDNVIIYETVDVPFQKWVNIFINYHNGTLDVFIDGELVGTRGSVAPYLTNDAVIAGSEPGVHGGICNVTYYKQTLSKKQIYWIYNSQKLLTNPTLF